MSGLDPAGRTAHTYVYQLTREVKRRTLSLVKTIRATNLRKKLYETLEDVRSRSEPVEVVLGSRSAAVLVPLPARTHRDRKPLVDLDAVTAFCKKYQVRTFSLFGSILRADFSASSDVDVLVDLGSRHIDVHEMFRMVDHLTAMFGRPVDMVELSNLASIDPVRREEITSTARVIYDEKLYDAAS